jgi:hypothetical protein
MDWENGLDGCHPGEPGYQSEQFLYHVMDEGKVWSSIVGFEEGKYDNQTWIEEWMTTQEVVGRLAYPISQV